MPSTATSAHTMSAASLKLMRTDCSSELLKILCIQKFLASSGAMKTVAVTLNTHALMMQSQTRTKLMNVSTEIRMGITT